MARRLPASLLFAALLASALQAAPRPKGPEVRLHLREAQPGEAVLIVVTGHHSARAPSGTFGGASLPFHRASAGAYLALAGIDLEASTGALKVALSLIDRSGVESSYSRELRVKAKAFATRNLTVSKAYTELEPELEARADAETARLKELFAKTNPELLLAGGFRMPIKGAKTTSRFGERSVFNGEPKSPHSGADIKASTGTPVLAPQAGRVVVAENLYFPGGTLVLDHGLGVYTLFAHLSKLEVPVGTLARPGQVVARAGASGRVTGPHLHWAVRVLGARVDPVSVTALPLGRYLKSR